MDYDLESIMRIPLKIIIGSMVVIMAALLFGQYVLGFGMWQGSMALNCPGYIDTIGNATAVGNNSYDGNLATIPYVCPLVRMAPAFIALAIIITMIIYMVSPGRNDQSQPQYQ